MLLKRKDLKFVNLILKKSILQNYETYNLAITKVLSIQEKIFYNCKSRDISLYGPVNSKFYRRKLRLSIRTPTQNKRGVVGGVPNSLHRSLCNEVDNTFLFCRQWV